MVSHRLVPACAATSPFLHAVDVKYLLFHGKAAQKHFKDIDIFLALNSE